jgi:NAD(P)-dependent dehydrogenase (short-subunit alcohol dehydrogenase family)
MDLLAGKVAIVMGASSGIGRATALRFAAEGARVVLGARRQGLLDEVVGEITSAGGEAVAYAGDVLREETAEHTVGLALEKFGRLDIAFNNSSTDGERGPAIGLSLAGFQKTLAINLTGAFLGAKHQIPAMIKSGGGSVIFTSTIMGSTFSAPEMAAYASSKAGLVGLTQTLAVEYGPQGVRVNSIVPGAVDTGMFKRAYPSPEAAAFVGNLHALKRIASPDEIAGSIVYLASDLSGFQTGTAMIVDGGFSINRS